MAANKKKPVYLIRLDPNSKSPVPKVYELLGEQRDSNWNLILVVREVK